MDILSQNHSLTFIKYAVEVRLLATYCQPWVDLRFQNLSYTIFTLRQGWTYISRRWQSEHSGAAAKQSADHIIWITSYFPQDLSNSRITCFHHYASNIAFCIWLLVLNNVDGDFMTYKDCSSHHTKTPCLGTEVFSYLI